MNFMGLIDSPDLSLHLLIHVKYIAHGYIKDPLNPLDWNQSRLNLPGDESYTPKLP